MHDRLSDDVIAKELDLWNGELALLSVDDQGPNS